MTKQLDLILSIGLSQRSREVANLAQTLMVENQKFQISQDPWDAGRVAATLRRIIHQAEVAALAFEAAAKAGGVNVVDPNRDPDHR